MIINLKHYIIPMDLFTNKNLSMDNFIFCIPFIPQVPIVMFICSVLGRKMALTSVLLYLIIGLFFVPVFALGGGIKINFHKEERE